MTVDIIPCLKDNYAYLVVCHETQEAAVVDPSEAAPVLEKLKDSPYTLKSIWNTHHHFDHVGGNEKLVEEFPNIFVYGSQHDKGRIPCQTHFLENGDEVIVGNHSAKVISNPGHTAGAISYYLNHHILFTGDTLFGAGCGRLFEGTPQEMQMSFDRLFALPKDTQVYCGHEYTQSNLRFAKLVDTNNKTIDARQKFAAVCGEKNIPTVPFTLATEMESNPFARTDNSQIIDSVNKHFKTVFQDKAQVFGALRLWKDNF